MMSSEKLNGVMKMTTKLGKIFGVLLLLTILLPTAQAHAHQFGFSDEVVENIDGTLTVTAIITTTADGIPFIQPVDSWNLSITSTCTLLNVTTIGTDAAAVGNTEVFTGLGLNGGAYSKMPFAPGVITLDPLAAPVTTLKLTIPATTCTLAYQDGVEEEVFGMGFPVINYLALPSNYLPLSEGVLTAVNKTITAAPTGPIDTTPSAIDFGTNTRGDAIVTQNYTITNTDSSLWTLNAALTTITGTPVPGSSEDPFTPPVLPAALNGGDNIVLTASYNPNTPGLAAGSHLQTITYTYQNAANPTETQEITLTLTGITEEIPFTVTTPQGVDFGAIPRGQEAVLSTFIENNTLDGINLTLTNSNNTDFRLIHADNRVGVTNVYSDYEVPLNQYLGAQSGVTLLFKPTNTGTTSTTLTITGAGLTQEITFTGEGVAYTEPLSIANQTLEYVKGMLIGSDVIINHLTENTLNYVITNNTEHPWELMDITTTGDSTNFESTLPSTIGLGETIIPVHFTLENTGEERTYTSVKTFTYRNFVIPSQETTLTLTQTGWGQNAVSVVAFSDTQDAISFGNVPVNFTTTPQKLEIWSNGVIADGWPVDNYHLTSVSIDNPAFTVVNLTLPDAINPVPDNSSVLVNFRPPSEGTYENTITLNFEIGSTPNAPGNPTFTKTMPIRGISTPSAEPVTTRPVELDFGTILLENSPTQPLQVALYNNHPFADYYLTDISYDLLNTDFQIIPHPFGPLLPQLLPPGTKVQSALLAAYAPGIDGTHTTTVTFTIAEDPFGANAFTITTPITGTAKDQPPSTYEIVAISNLAGTAPNFHATDLIVDFAITLNTPPAPKNNVESWTLGYAIEAPCTLVNATQGDPSITNNQIITGANVTSPPGTEGLVQIASFGSPQALAPNFPLLNVTLDLSGLEIDESCSVYPTNNLVANPSTTIINAVLQNGDEIPVDLSGTQDTVSILSGRVLEPRYFLVSNSQTQPSVAGEQPLATIPLSLSGLDLSPDTHPQAWSYGIQATGCEIVGADLQGTVLELPVPDHHAASIVGTDGLVTSTVPKIFYSSQTVETLNIDTSQHVLNLHVVPNKILLPTEPDHICTFELTNTLQGTTNGRAVESIVVTKENNQYPLQATLGSVVFQAPEIVPPTVSLDTGLVISEDSQAPTLTTSATQLLFGTYEYLDPDQSTTDKVQVNVNGTNYLATLTRETTLPGDPLSLFGTWTAAVPLAEAPQTNTLTVTARNLAGDSNAIGPYYVTSDRTNPTLTLAPFPPGGTTYLGVNVSCTDNETGCQSITYSVNSGIEQTVICAVEDCTTLSLPQIDITTGENLSITATANDFAENTATTQQTFTGIVPPLISYVEGDSDLDGFTDTITITCTETGRGCATIFWDLEGIPLSENTGPNEPEYCNEDDDLDGDGIVNDEDDDDDGDGINDDEDDDDDNDGRKDHDDDDDDNDGRKDKHQHGHPKHNHGEHDDDNCIPNPDGSIPPADTEGFGVSSFTCEDPFAPTCTTTINLPAVTEVITLWAIDTLTPPTPSEVVTFELDSDTCSGLYGQYQGCPYGHNQRVDLHLVVQKKELRDALCNGKGSCKLPQADALVRIFNRDDSAFQALWTNNPSKRIYNDVFEDTTGLIANCSTVEVDHKKHAHGECTAGTNQPGNYLVITKYIDEETGKRVYVGKKRDQDDFNEQGISSKKLKIMKVYKKNGNIQLSGGKKSVVVGSQLDIVSPEEAIWEEQVLDFVYPFIMTSDDNWTVDLCAEVPAGYSITGVYDEEGDLISTTECAQTFLAGETKVIAFEVTQVGSPPEWEFTAKMTAIRPNKRVKNLSFSVDSTVQVHETTTVSSTEQALTQIGSQLAGLGLPPMQVLLGFLAVISLAVGAAIYFIRNKKDEETPGWGN